MSTSLVERLSSLSIQIGRDISSLKTNLDSIQLVTTESINSIRQELQGIKDSGGTSQSESTKDFAAEFREFMGNANIVTGEGSGAYGD